MEPTQKIIITESPRDAFQGIKQYIPASIKASLINILIHAKPDIIDVGSFVSSKVIPQMKDTPEVLELIKPEDHTKIMVIAGNEFYARAACAFSQVDLIGFPFSVSGTFLQKNLNSDFNKAWNTICAIQETCLKSKKNLVIYITMAFGNPYGDPFNNELLSLWIEKFINLDIRLISLTDPPGMAEPDGITNLFTFVQKNYGNKINCGFHLHTDPFSWESKIDAAFNAGIRWFDGVITGHGGCPMTGKPLLGNVSTKLLINYLKEKQCTLQIDIRNVEIAIQRAEEIFTVYQ